MGSCACSPTRAGPPGPGRRQDGSGPVEPPASGAAAGKLPGHRGNRPARHVVPAAPPGRHYDHRRQGQRRTARSRDHGLLELLPTSRCSIGYHYQGTGYVVHPDATFWLDLAHLGTCGSVPGSECRAKRRPDSCCWRRPTVRRCSTPPSVRAIGDGVPAIRR